ncbi:hypothetical protein HH304_02155 [Flammeovirgaceae bacterium KN852]|uniref:LTD domain-containing protein n=2 Tax=Marinigracilibium pacificum TaxID=2729599 RepID=A0A848IS63_9BACT|nr:hypothetical protein [Marinigracilibium pacificum]
MGQITDHFDDQEFNKSGHWKGNTHEFRQENGYLISQFSTDKTSSYLFYELNSEKPLKYEFQFDLGFSPSGSNKLQIVLFGEFNDVEISSGIVLEIGESGSDDGINLVEYSSGTREELAKWSIGDYSNNPSKQLIVLYDGASAWQLFEVTAESEILVGEWQYLPDKVNAMSGMRFMYTSTRIDKFKFDYWNVEQLENSEIGPSVTNVVSTSSSIEIEFSKEIECSDVEIVLLIDDTSIESSIKCIGNRITVEFQEILKPMFNAELTINGLKDVQGNSISELRIIHQYLDPDSKGLMITELLPSPDRLSEYPSEFIELYNLGDQILNLGNYQLCDRSKCVTLPEMQIGANEVIVLTPLNSDISNAIKVDNLPSLNNDNDDIVLKLNQKQVDELGYYKSEFGVSIKRRFRNYYCDKVRNLKNEIPDPGIVEFEDVGDNAVDPQIILTDYNKGLKLKLDNYHQIDDVSLMVDNIKTEILDVTPVIYSNYSIHKFIISETLKLSQTNIEIDNVLNCLTNERESFQFENFEILESKESDCLKVSEFMFNPEGELPDFVELVNVCNSAIELDKYELIFANEENEIDDTIRFTSVFDEYFIGGRQVVLISEDSDFLKESYNIYDYPVFIQADDFPNLRNSGGHLHIQRSYDSLIFENEKSGYFESWHSKWLNNTEGVSLERYDFNSDPLQGVVWRSASEIDGYRSPGKLSSNEKNNSVDIDLQPELLIPGDLNFGAQSIYFEVNEAGQLITMELFSLSGELVKTFCIDCFVSGEGVLRWEGLDDKGKIISPGHYLLRLIKLTESSDKQLLYRTLSVGIL